MLYVRTQHRYEYNMLYLELGGSRETIRRRGEHVRKIRGLENIAPFSDVFRRAM